MLQRGDLVPDKIIVKLIEDWLHLHGGYGFVFDGFPRTLPQAESLASILKSLHTSLDAAIWLDVSEETVRSRISGRLQCRDLRFHHQRGQRAVCQSPDLSRIAKAGSSGEAMMIWACCKQRLREYNTKTQPLADFYGKMSILRQD